MNTRLRKTFLLLPIVLALLVLVALWLADSWLESDAGRSRLESALADGLGMPVFVRGDFSISFLPSIGIAGTDLLIGGAQGAGPFVQSEAFHVNIALLPLIRKELHILALTASRGFLDPWQFRTMNRGEQSAPGTGFGLPRIERLVLEDFRIALSGSELRVQHFELEAFHPGVTSPLNFRFSVHSGAAEIASINVRSSLLVSPRVEQITLEIQKLEIESEWQKLQGISGDFAWASDQQLLEAHLAWPGNGAGAVNLAASMNTDLIEGILALDFQALDVGPAVTARVEFAIRDKGVDLPGIRATFAEQQVTGSGCLLTGESPVLNLQLNSDYVNLDQLEAFYSEGGEAGQTLPFDLNLVFSILEFHAAGAVAHQSEIRAGVQPDCGFLRN